MLEVCSEVGALAGKSLDCLKELTVLVDLGAGSLGRDLGSPFEGPVRGLDLGIRSAGEPASGGMVRREHQKQCQGPCFPGSPLQGHPGAAESTGDEPVAQ